MFKEQQSTPSASFLNINTSALNTHQRRTKRGGTHRSYVLSEVWTKPVSALTIVPLQLYSFISAPRRRKVSICLLISLSLLTWHKNLLPHLPNWVFSWGELDKNREKVVFFLRLTQWYSCLLCERYKSDRLSFHLPFHFPPWLICLQKTHRGCGTRRDKLSCSHAQCL